MNDTDLSGRARTLYLSELDTIVEHKNSPLNKTTHAINDMIGSIELLYEKEHYYPSVMLQYSLIDICGWLKYGESNPSSVTFKKWAKEYVLSQTPAVKFNVDDLWSARCGLLHMFSSDSRDYKRGMARGIAYSFTSKGYKQLIAYLKTKDLGGDSVPMDNEQFKNVLVEAAMAFRDELVEQPIDADILDRMKKLDWFVMA